MTKRAVCFTACCTGDPLTDILLAGDSISKAIFKGPRAEEHPHENVWLTRLAGTACALKVRFFRGPV